MKAKGFIGFAAVLLVLLFAGCGARGGAQPADVSAGTTEEKTTVQTSEAETAQSGETAQEASDGSGDPAQTRSAAADSSVSSSAAGGKGETASAQQTGDKAGKTTVPSGKTTSVPQLKPPASGTDAKTRESEKTSEGTTRAQSGGRSTTAAATTAASGSGSGIIDAGTKPGKPEKTTGSGSATGTTKPTNPTKPSNPTKPDDPTKPDTTEKAEDVTKREEAKGNLVKAKVTYLNDTPRNYVSALTEETLEKFGVPDGTKKDILKHPSDWTAYTIELEFVNNEAVPITLYGLEVTDNGAANVYINGQMSAEIGISSGRQTSEVFYVLAKKSDQDADVLFKIHNMKMRVKYAASPENDSDEPKSYVYATVG